MATDAFSELKFRDPRRAQALAAALERGVQAIGRAPVSVMHVCGSHEQAIARFGLRAVLPRALHVIMGPGCPVCITDVPEVDDTPAGGRGDRGDDDVRVHHVEHEEGAEPEGDPLDVFLDEGEELFHG